MQQRTAESRLSIVYTLCIAMGATASITSGIAWGHWKQTLDQCVDRNCSCIFYAVDTPIHFLGGNLPPCIWITFGPLLYVLFCFGFSCFHGYRVLFGSRGPTTRTITTKNEAGETIVMQAVQSDNTSHLPRSFWITGAVFTSICTVYALVHFSVFLDGYLSTCNEYRKTIIKQLKVLGTVIPVVHNRLSCNAIYDFMDYIQQDTGNAYRDGFINTAADLIIGLLASVTSWLLFAYAAIVNIRFARIRY